MNGVSSPARQQRNSSRNVVHRSRQRNRYNIEILINFLIKNFRFLSSAHCHCLKVPCIAQQIEGQHRSQKLRHSLRPDEASINRQRGS